MTDRASTFVYVTYIKTTPERVWSALTDPEIMPKYWFGVHQESDWKPGSDWKMILADGRVADAGKVIEIEPNKRLVLEWTNQFRPELKAEGASRCVLEIEPHAEGVVKLTVTHGIDVPQSKLVEAVSGGWPRIFANLKSMLETGEPLMVEKV